MPGPPRGSPPDGSVLVQPRNFKGTLTEKEVCRP